MCVNKQLFGNNLDIRILFNKLHQKSYRELVCFKMKLFFTNHMNVWVYYITRSLDPKLLSY